MVTKKKTSGKATKAKTTKAKSVKTSAAKSGSHLTSATHKLVPHTYGARRVHPRGTTGKRQLTHDQEFEIFKLVLDKFLWVGLLVMVYGVWRLVSFGLEGLKQGVSFIVVGAVVLMIFMAVLVKEFEFIE